MKVTAEDIAQLLASAPPRLVPAHVTKAAQRQGASIAGAVVGVIFAIMGLFFTMLFFPRHLRDEWRLDREGQTTGGIVTAVTGTSMKVNKQPVMETTFAYTLDGGKRQAAACFSTGSQWNVGETVTVRYLPDNPAIACIEGGRLDEAGSGGGLVVLFPLIGVGSIVIFVRQRAALRRMLVSGHTAELDVLSVDQTSTRVNGRYVYRIRVSAPAGGAPLTLRRSNPADIELAQRHAAQKEPVFALYDPRRPTQVLFPEGLIDPPAP